MNQLAQQTLSAGLEAPSTMRPDSPLHELSPGALSKLSPLERGKKLKRTKKHTSPPAALLSAPTVMG